MIEQLAQEMGLSRLGLENNLMFRFSTQVPAGISAETALGASATTYFALGRLANACTVTRVTMRTHAGGTSTTTIDLLYAIGGTALSAGTAVMTTVRGNTLINDTDYHAVVNSDGTQNIAAESILGVKIATAASETLCPLEIEVEIKG